MQSFSHPFFDIEIEPDELVGDASLVKVLSVDGRRFTYQVYGPLDDAAVDYMKSLMDAGVFGDLIIERSGDSLDAREAPGQLKKHS